MCIYFLAPPLYIIHLTLDQPLCINSVYVYIVKFRTLYMVLQFMSAHLLRAFFFANLLQVTIIYVASVRPSVCMEQLGYHWTYFYEILYFNIFF